MASRESLWFVRFETLHRPHMCPAIESTDHNTLYRQTYLVYDAIIFTSCENSSNDQKEELAISPKRNYFQHTPLENSVESNGAVGRFVIVMGNNQSDIRISSHGFIASAWGLQFNQGKEDFPCRYQVFIKTVHVWSKSSLYILNVETCIKGTFNHSYTIKYDKSS